MDPKKPSLPVLPLGSPSMKVGSTPATHHLHFKEQVFAGAAAGLVEVLIMYPLDVVKTRLQLQKGTGKYTSVLQTFRTIAKEEGPLNLYRGILSPIMAEAPKRAVKFAANEQYKPMFADKEGRLSNKGAAYAGACAGATEAVINCPFEVVKIRLQAPETLNTYKNTLDALIKITRGEGMWTLYSGFEAQIWRNVVWNSAYFGTISLTKQSMWKPESKPSEMFRNFVAGFIAGTFATTLNTPLDVVKSRLQNMKGKKMWSIPALLKVYQEEGFQALYKGYIPRILRLGPGGGIMLLAFDFVAGLLEKRG